jgi:hypothetical protein
MYTIKYNKDNAQCISVSYYTGNTKSPMLLQIPRYLVRMNILLLFLVHSKLSVTDGKLSNWPSKC